MINDKFNSDETKSRIKNLRRKKRIKSCIKTVVVYSIFSMLAMNLYLLYSSNCLSSSIRSLTSLSDYSVVIDSETSDNCNAAYSLGASIANDLALLKKEQEKSVGRMDNKYIVAGFIDALNGNSQISVSDIDKNLSLIDEKISQDIQNKFDEIAKNNIDAEKKFLNDNRTKKGVYETLSGLQYKVIHTNSKGRKFNSKTDATAVISYKGKTLKDEVFDQNSKYSVNISDVIPGLAEAISLMREGDEFEIYIPSALAYGHHAVGSIIEPYSTLIFTVKLLQIKN